ncbi:MAG: hypothetical protein GX358_00645 [candidate division WS1 bacterium]|jgi:hypothetical protein|nr:hypothetical protein [candidate division WS1 bacterium]
MNKLLPFSITLSAILLASGAMAQNDAPATDAERHLGPLHGKGAWELITEEAAFSPRDTAEPLVYDGKMWISNGYYHGNILTRDLWSSTDGVTWTSVNEDTPYTGYSEMVAYDGKMWAIKGGVWTSTDGIEWTEVLEEAPFGVRAYGETVVFQDKIWQLGSGAGVWNTTDGVNWTRVLDDAPYSKRSACAVGVHDGKLWLCGGRVGVPNDPPEKGYESVTTYNDVWCSEDGVNWTRVLEHAPWSPRMWFVAETYRGYLWIFGGYDNVNNQNLGDVWYTKDGVTWYEFVSDPQWAARHEPTTYVYDDSLWMVAGNTWPVVNDVWRLTLPQEE